MSSRRLRVLVLCVALLVLVAGGGFWVAARPGTNSPVVDAPTGFAAPTTPTTEVDKSLAPNDPLPPVAPAERVAPAVSAAIAATGTTEVLVVFDAEISGTDEEKRAQVQAGIDSITESLPEGSWSVAGETPTDPTANLIIDARALSVLQQRPGIRRVQSALHEFYPAEVSSTEELSSELGVSANLATMGASTPVTGAWASGFKGAGKTIAVLDTGVQTDHPFLMNGTVQKTVGEACFASAFGYSTTCPGGASMSVSEPSKVGAGAPCPVDIVIGTQKECIHGTHVAGIAVGGNGTGNSGIAPEASLISVQVFSYKYATNRITSTTGDIDDALQWLYNRRADFPGLTAVNLSLGDGLLYTGFCNASEASTYSKVQQLLDVGIVTVVAAGNESRTTGVSAPACLQNVVTVSALTDGSGADLRAGYSNIGPQVNVFAPGTLTSSIPCDGIVALRGTSMATPAVSGAIALLRQGTVGATVALLEDSGGPVAGYLQPSVKLDNAIVGLPGPTGPVSGVASGSQVAVSWSAASPGSGTLSSYTVTAAPGGQTCTTSGLTCTVAGLDPAKSYVFTVVPTGSSGVGPGRSSSPVPMPNVPAAPTEYVPLNPVRLLDTRSISARATTIDGNDLGCGAVGQGLGSVRTLVVVGRGGVPSTGVDAVALNVTVVDPSSANYLKVYPEGSAPPNAANINFVAGQTIPNMVIAKVGVGGKIAIFNNSLSTQVVVDVVGWFPANPLSYEGINPERMLDTRAGGLTIDGSQSGTGPLIRQQTYLLPVTNRGSVPATGVGAVVLNLAVVNPTVGNFVSVFPGNSSFGGTASINFSAGQTISNMVITKVAPDGTIGIYNNAGNTQITVDVVGWFPTTSGFQSFAPQRFVDTRSPGAPSFGSATIDGQYQAIGPIPPGGSIDVVMTGRLNGNVPATGVGAVALNVTVVGSTAKNFLKLSPKGGAQTTVANLNFVAGDTISNMAIVKVGVGGKITIYNNAGWTPVVVDVVGYFPG
jgi:subtilisin family serine protease